MNPLLAAPLAGLLAAQTPPSYPGVRIPISGHIGLVLVDPTHESAVLYNLKKGGWVRLRELATDRFTHDW